MDDQLRREAVREHVKKKFQGKESLVSKTRLHYPDSAEREYKRVTNAYMRLLSKIIKEDLIPEIRKAANAELDADYYRQDGVSDLVRRLTLNEALKLWSLYQMDQDIQSGQAEEMKRNMQK